jgi:hypothetical protein
VDANTITRVNIDKHTFEYAFKTALLYKLQTKKSLKSNADNTKDTLTSIQLSVIWRVDDNYKLYINTMLIKHNNIIT